MRKAAFAAILAFCATGSMAEVDKKTERTWKAKCASCHGVDGKGQTASAQQVGLPDFSTPAWQKANTDEKIRKSISEGATKEKGGNKLEMDPYKDKLDAEQIEKLIAYIRSLAG